MFIKQRRITTNIMRLYYFTAVFVMSFFAFCTYEMTKDDYVNQYTSFIQEVEANKSSYSDKDWEEKDSLFALYQTPIPLLSEGSENYKKFSPELSEEEKDNLNRMTGKYMAWRAIAIGSQIYSETIEAFEDSEQKIEDAGKQLESLFETIEEELETLSEELEKENK